MRSIERPSENNYYYDKGTVQFLYSILSDIPDIPLTSTRFVNHIHISALLLFSIFCTVTLTH